MCGLICVISKLKGGLYHSDVKIFTELLFADQLRGADGTGIIYNKKTEIKTLKAAMGSSDFVNNERYDNAIDEAVKCGNFLVGHNRAATKGKLSHENTHPFKEGHITLVHNGTLPNHKYLAAVENDSNAIARAFASKGAKTILKNLDGAYALIWTDVKQKTLNFVRNSQRPLWLISTKDLYIFVSEKDLGYWICNRNNQHVISALEVPVGTLFQFEFSDFSKYETQKIDIYTPPVFVPQKYSAPSINTSAGIKLGETIKYTATGISKEFGIKLLGEYKTGKGDVYEVNFWCTTIKDAERLLKIGTLVGKISHEVFNTNNKTTKLIVNSAHPYDGAAVKALLEAPKNVTTKNGVLLTRTEIDSLDNRCSYCTTIFDKKLLHSCDVTQQQDKTFSSLCPDCSEWFEFEHTKYGNGV